MHPNMLIIITCEGKNHESIPKFEELYQTFKRNGYTPEENNNKNILSKQTASTLLFKSQFD